MHEDGLIEALDSWLRSDPDPDRVETTVDDLCADGQSPLAEDSRQQAITGRVADA